MHALWRMLSRNRGSALLAGLALAVGLIAAPARAEREPSAYNAYWADVNAGGCTVILNMGALYLAPGAGSVEGTNWPASIRWQGPCANGLANGQGTLQVAVQFMENNFSTDYRSTYKGEMRDGVMTGRFELQTVNNDGSGTYSTDYPPEYTTYANGCDAEWDLDNECRFADAQAIQARYGVRTGGGAGGGGSPSAMAGSGTYSTVGGAAVAPPKFDSGQENALSAVSDALIGVLGGRGGPSFANGGITVDAILANLRSSLGLDGNAALGGRGDLLDLVLGQVRDALGGANPASTNGQIASLVMTTLRMAIADGARPRAQPVAVAAADPVFHTVSAPATASSLATSPASGPAPTAARTVSAANVQSVIDYLASKGDGVTRGTDDSGRPKLTEAGNYYTVNFYDCDAANAQCKTLQFNACYANLARANAAAANSWNGGYVLAKSYINAKGWVCLELPVVTGAGGVGYDAMDLAYDAFKWFRENKDTQFN